MGEEASNGRASGQALSGVGRGGKRTGEKRRSGEAGKEMSG